MLHMKKLGGVLLLFLLIAAASAAALRFSSLGSELPWSATNNKSKIISLSEEVSTKAAVANGAGTYIVLFKEAPLAMYKGGKSGLAVPAKIMLANGKSRLDVKSYESRKYVEYLVQQQRSIEKKMAAATGSKAFLVRNRMQHAVNGIVVDLSAESAAKIAKMPDVLLVEAYSEVPLDTDTGPAHIGAAAMWSGSYAGATGSYQGEGTVVGIIDSGINFGSPSFSAVDPVDSYAHINPLGAGNYFGTCATGGIDVGRCNNKLIGGYDFVCGAPASQCGLANIREEPGFGDSNSHGSHTASTVAGNRRDVVFSGSPRRISGVAPRANIIAYDVCYTNTATNQGLCPSVSSLAAVNQAIADGIVDTLNFSIGGGASPWGESVSLAFLSAVDAGIYVAASAGNSGPDANTLGHVEPWVSTTAAAQHGRGAFALLMQVTGPGVVPANLAPLVVNQGSGGVTFSATIPGTTPLRVSSAVDTSTDGCSGYAAGTFAGAIAVIRRGGCTFGVKTNSATAAGAIAVVIANNQAGVILPSVPGTTIPVFSVTTLEGNALRDFNVANPTATAQISFPAVGLPNTADALGSFSSRGPAGTFDLVKPDITGPGVDILAVTSGTVITGSEQAIGLLSGTSMSSPHNAGSGTLMRQARPTWTVPEIKSALMMTATTTVFTEDQVTLANPFARGSGRLQIDRAVKAGLVLHETTARFQAANPATAGDPKTLNIASYANRSCSPTCTFTRTFRNTQAADRMWNVKIKGLFGSVSSPSIIIPAGQSRSLNFTINTSTLSNNGIWSFGEIELTPSLTTPVADRSPVLRMPVAVAVQPPVISMPASLSAVVPNNSAGAASFTIANIGGSSLNYTFVNSGTAPGVLVNTTGTTTGSGFRSTRYSDPATAGNQAQFAADDFVLSQTTPITSLFVEGFTLVAPPLSTVSPTITWSIYPDAAGLPAGNPVTQPGAAVWTYTAGATSAGVTTTSDAVGDNILINLTAAGQNVSLPAGRYWLVVNGNSTIANRWLWLQSTQISGFNGAAALTVSTTGTGAWAPVTSGTFAGLSMRVNGSLPCGASWMIGTTALSGILARGTSRSASTAVNSTGLASGTYGANVCVQSNDPVTPNLAVPFSMTVTSPP